MTTKTVFVIGAGFSKGYTQSKSGQRMPVAKDFFQTFNRLSISESGWVLVGHLLNYCRDRYGVPYDEFEDFDVDIETIHSNVHQELLSALEAKDGLKLSEMWSINNQLIFLFASVLNEIQNGQQSRIHDEFVKTLNPADSIITFNWDTLIDRALSASKLWAVDNGYLFRPSGIYENGWRAPIKTGTRNRLIKLHGSTNWITSHPIIDDRWEIKPRHSSGLDSVYVYKDTITPYPCYDGRYMSGYSEFSYGYYPPNIPEYLTVKNPEHINIRMIQRNGINPKGESTDIGLASMPLIIPPIKLKKYDFYGDLFPSLWKAAEQELSEAAHIVIAGYSFPKTDKQSRDLFKSAFLKMRKMPTVTIVNPDPDAIEHIVKMDLGITSDRVTVIKDYIDNDFDFSRLRFST